MGPMATGLRGSSRGSACCVAPYRRADEQRWRWQHRGSTGNSTVVPHPFHDLLPLTLLSQLECVINLHLSLTRSHTWLPYHRILVGGYSLLHHIVYCTLPVPPPSFSLHHSSRLETMATSSSTNIHPLSNDSPSLTRAQTGTQSTVPLGKQS